MNIDSVAIVSGLEGKQTSGIISASNSKKKRNEILIRRLLLLVRTWVLEKKTQNIKCAVIAFWQNARGKAREYFEN